MKRVLLAAALLALPAHAQVKIDVGSTPVMSGAPLHIAKEKGYFAANGLEVEMHRFASAAQSAAPLATGRLQAVGGAMSINFFTSVDQGLPTKLVMSRNSSPTLDYILARPGVTLAKPADLKGKTIGINARGSVATYEVGKMLETAGLTLRDVEIKYMPFNQMSVAFVNAAIDAAMMVPPLVDLVSRQGIAVKALGTDETVPQSVQPIMIAVVQINTDWAAKNEKAAYGFVEAVIRGVRDYCTAYHNGPNREEVKRIIAATSDVADPNQLDGMPWNSPDPDGRLFAPSVLDIQDFYFREGLIGRKFTLEQLVDDRYRAAAVQKLGPFQVPQGSSKPGCRS